MTVSIVDKQMLDEIVAGFRLYGLTELLDEAGQMLANENVASVHERYPFSTGDVAPDYNYKPIACTVGQLARSITHYCYQACESPSWVDSEARALCLRLSFAMLSEIPGYHAGEAR